MSSKLKDFFEINRAPGIYIFSSQPRWDTAYMGAQSYLESLREKELQNSSLNAFLCFGPHIGKASIYYIEEKVFSSQKITFGKNTSSWKDWVNDLCFHECLLRGNTFEGLTDIRRREYLYTILSKLEASAKLSNLSGIWKEEKIFSTLLSLIEEFRLAGFSTHEPLSQLEDALKKYTFKEEDSCSDLVQILLVWEEFLKNIGLETKKHFCDFPGALKLLNSFNELRINKLYLLGFQKFSTLEIEFIQKIARFCQIYIPLNETEEDINKALKGRNLESSSSIKAIVHMSTNYTGKIKAISFADNKEGSSKVFPRILLKAQTNMEELRSCAFFLQKNKNKFNNIQLLVDSFYFSSSRSREELNRIFEEGDFLGSSMDALMESDLLRSILLGIRILILDFPFLETNSFAYFLSKVKLGIRMKDYHYAISSLDKELFGFSDWESLEEKEKSKENKNWSIIKYISCLRKMKEIFPKSGYARDYDKALRKYIAEFSFAEFVFLDSNEENRRKAHSILGAILKAAASLSSEYSSHLSLERWFYEFYLLLEKQSFPELRRYNARLKVYKIEEWLPPLEEKDIRIFLGFEEGIEPRAIHNLIVSESSRRSLSDYAILNTSLLQKDFLKWFTSAQDKTLFFSYAQYDKKGKEKLKCNAMHLISHRTLSWPVLSSIYKAPDKYQDDKSNFIVEKINLDHVSASFMDSWKTCPFKCLVERVWRIKDKLSDSSLEIQNHSLGSIVHKCLELFFLDKAHRNPSKEERREILEASLKDAFESVNLESYKGTKILREKEKYFLLKRLEKFTDMEFEYYKHYPLITETRTEEDFVYKMPKGPLLEGRIDRIDIDKDNKRFLVVDYKLSSTSMKSAKEIREKTSFQLPIYLEVVEKSFKLGSAIGAYFLSTKETESRKLKGILVKDYQKKNSKGTKKETDLNVSYYYNSRSRNSIISLEEFQELRDASMKELSRIWNEVQKGNFSVKPLEPNYCERCEIRPACRIREKFYLVKQDTKKEAKEYEALWYKVQEEISADLALEEELSFSEEHEKLLSSQNNFIFLEASAGTGKTTMLVERYFRELKNLIEENKSLSPELVIDRILAISFTEKSVADMKAKLFKKIAFHYEAELAFQCVRNITTIHGFCRSVLQDSPDKLNSNPVAEVLDEAHSRRIFEQSLEEFYLSLHKDEMSFEKENWDYISKFYSKKDLDSILSLFYEKRNLLEYDEREKSISFKELDTSVEDIPNILLKKIWSIAIKIFGICDEKKKRESVLDYDDLERIALQILSEKEHSYRYTERYRLLLVDEFQDTNIIQREIIHRITRKDKSNLFIVGDAKQSIYNFRGSDVSVFLKLREEANKENKLHILHTNYRSQKHIVEFSNILSENLFEINRNLLFDPYHAQVTAKKDKKSPIFIYQYNKKKLNASGIRKLEARTLIKILANLVKKGRSLGDIAILCSKTTSLEPYFRALQEAEIPFTLSKAGNIFQESIVLDSVALLRYLYFYKNKLSLLSILRSPWAKCSASLIQEIMQNEKDMEEEEHFSWLKALKKSLYHLSPSQALWKAYAYYPPFSDQYTRQQGERFLDIVEENEKKFTSSVELVCFLSRLVGWKKEVDASRDSSIPLHGEKGVLQIMTMHGSKGLEFPVCILLGLDFAGRKGGFKSPVSYQLGQGFALKYTNEEGEELESNLYNTLWERKDLSELAEKKRLLYVAATRAKDEMYILLQKENKKSSSMGNFLRNIDFKEHVEIIDVDDEEFRSKEQAISNIPQELTSIKTPLLSNSSGLTEAILIKNEQNVHYLKRHISVTELSSFEFCPYFHRWKFLERWDDEVLVLLKNKRKFKNQSKQRFLEELSITKKERGIAIHQLLERLKPEKMYMEQWQSWLLDSYYAQGVSNQNKEALELLIKNDIQDLKNFLATQEGKKLFSPSLIAFPEIPFAWEHKRFRISGTVDRLLMDSSSKNYWIVDYKTSVVQAQHRFQILSYGFALESYLEERGLKAFKIHLWLIDVLEGKTYKVPLASSDWKQKDFLSLEENYGKKEFPPILQKKVNAESCKRCPYLSHCSFAKKI